MSAVAFMRQKPAKPEGRRVRHVKNSAAATLTRDDLRFVAEFEGLTLPVERFHHSDHVRLAFVYFCKYHPLVAIDRFATKLQRFAAFAGKPNLYHETITWAFLFIIRERMARSARRQLRWSDFAKDNPDLITKSKGLLGKFYRDETLNSPLARTTFLFPDRI
jgi:hypothetical protein